MSPVRGGLPGILGTRPGVPSEGRTPLVYLGLDQVSLVRVGLPGILGTRPGVPSEG